MSTLTDPLHSVGFTYDGANRPTKVLLPDTNSILSSFDPNGNVLSITPPGRLAHAFSYQGADLETDYTPPAVDALSTGHPKTSYNLDQQVSSIAPDGVPAITLELIPFCGVLPAVGGGFPDAQDEAAIPG